MARPQKHDWNEIENYYKAGMPQSEISKKFGVSKGRLSSRVSEHQWVVSEQVAGKVNAVISAVDSVTELSDGEQRAVSDILTEKLKHRELFSKSALNNQSIANLALQAVHSTIKNAKNKEEAAAMALAMLPALEVHGKVTERNKNIVLGKEAETNLVVNNTNAVTTILVKYVD